MLCRLSVSIPEVFDISSTSSHMRRPLCTTVRFFVDEKFLQVALCFPARSGGKLLNWEFDALSVLVQYMIPQGFPSVLNVRLFLGDRSSDM